MSSLPLSERDRAFGPGDQRTDDKEWLRSVLGGVESAWGFRHKKERERVCEKFKSDADADSLSRASRFCRSSQNSFSRSMWDGMHREA